MNWQAGWLLSCLFLIAQPAEALYSWDEAQSRGDARLLLRGFALASRKPSKPAVDQERDKQALGGLARIMADSRYQQGWHVEFNAYQTYMSRSLVAEQGSLGTVLDVERSGLLEWSLSDTEYAQLAVDRLNAHWSAGRFDIRLGRQAINLASTFFFTPNDFFAPFASQAFYRVYKPGVDAIRSEIAVGDLGSLSVIAVQGYRQDSSTDSGWSDDAETSRNSYLTRYIANAMGFEWNLMAGKVRRTRVQGGAISGELFGWLGLRAEGHRLEEIDKPGPSLSKYSIGLEHRWENSFMLQIEQYYHGPGAVDVNEYVLDQAYPARRYQAMGMSFEFTPLMLGQLSVVHNQIDSSRLYNLNAVYSLSNESELSIDLSLPEGQTPAGSVIRSEFGAYPRILNIEIRAYF